MLKSLRQTLCNLIVASKFYINISSVILHIYELCTSLLRTPSFEVLNEQLVELLYTSNVMTATLIHSISPFFQPSIPESHCISDTRAINEQSIHFLPSNYPKILVTFASSASQSLNVSLKVYCCKYGLNL